MPAEQAPVSQQRQSASRGPNPADSSVSPPQRVAQAASPIRGAGVLAASRV